MGVVLGVCFVSFASAQHDKNQPKGSHYEQNCSLIGCGARYKIYSWAADHCISDMEAR